MNRDALITSILQVNTISHITKDKRRIISNEDLFIQLAFLDVSDLIKIANELYIKV